jgi:hypothetical protein
MSTILQRRPHQAAHRPLQLPSHRRLPLTTILASLRHLSRRPAFHLPLPPPLPLPMTVRLLDCRPPASHPDHHPWLLMTILVLRPPCPLRLLHLGALALQRHQTAPCCLHKASNGALYAHQVHRAYSLLHPVRTTNPARLSQSARAAMATTATPSPASLALTAATLLEAPAPASLAPLLRARSPTRMHQDALVSSRPCGV